MIEDDIPYFENIRQLTHFISIYRLWLYFKWHKAA